MVYTITKRICLPLLLLLTIILSQSCSAPNYIVNDWKVQKFQPGVDFSQSPEHMKIFSEFEKNASLELKKDGTYMFDMVMDKQLGKWKFDKKTMTLTTTSENNVVSTSKVLELTEDKLVLEQHSEGYNNIITFVPKQ